MSCSAAQRFYCRIASISPVIFSLILAASLSGRAHAQTSITSTALSVSGDNMTPTPGGHDYIHLFAETVSPANGSVSYRVNYPMPQGRGISYPAWWGYNSAGLYQLMFLSPEQTLNWVSNPLNFNSSLPHVTYQESQIPAIKYQCGQSPSTQCQLWPCNYATGFTFVGLDGVSHNVGILVAGPSQGPPPPTWQGVSPCGNGYVVPGGDGEVSGQFTNQDTTISNVEAWNSNPQNIPAVSGPVGPYTITEKDGTTYFFGGTATYNSAAQIWVDLPSKIEDHNGNLITFSADTLGRSLGGGIQYPAPTAPAGAPASVPINYLITHQKAYSTSYGEVIQCPWATGDYLGQITGAIASWNGIGLPDSTQYTFYYGTYNPTDSTISNNFGLVNEVVYPGGGWIKYKWNIETNINNSTSMAEFTGTGLTSGLQRIGACFVRYSVPTLASRTVSYDGITIAQTQTYQYATTWATNWPNNPGDWSAKTTTVTTTDNVLGKTSKTIYTYTPMAAAGTTNAMGGGVATELPMERTIQYFDWGNLSTPLKVVYKAWWNEFEEMCELTSINGLTSGHFYKYLGTSGSYLPSDYVTDDQEFDYGVISNPSVCGTQTTAGVAPTRETKTTYQSVQVPTGVVPTAGSSQIGGVFQVPMTVITYDGQGNRLAETDYGIDGGTLTDPGTVVQHDDANYSASTTSRGNVTSITRQCFTSNCTSPSPQTTFAYDKAGQVVSKTEPCGNIAGGCADIPGSNSSTQTTSYSYTDSPLNGNAAGPSDAYVTKIVYPPAGNVTHQVSFSYYYALGDLTSSTDQNGQPTTYSYECSSTPCSALDRLTQSLFPDGGKTSLFYNDWASVTTKQLITASGNPKISTVVMDGMFRNVQAQLNSDPESADYTDTTLDAEGRAIAVSNPHRTVSSTTDGTTQSIADILGRPLKITKQDGSYATTLYNDPCFIMTNAYGVTVTDEAGNHRRSCTDGLGRLVEVDEPGIGGQLTAGSTTISVSGGSGGTANPCYPNYVCPIYNSGNINITINGVTVGAGWSGDPSFTIQNLVAQLVSNLNSTGYVSATSSGNAIAITALQRGAASNYPFSITTVWNTQYFSSPSYTASPASGSFTGGSGYDFYSTVSFITLYKYDLLGNLLCVWQRGSDTTSVPAFSYSAASNTSNCLSAAPAVWRPRSFSYDSLSRLISATNPESGTITYSYDANGNVSSKTAPQPNQIGTATETTNYQYDMLNRMTQKSYTGMTTPATATVKYGYDGIAPTGCAPPSLTDNYPKPRRTSVCDGAGASSWSHDPMGRISKEVRTTAGVTLSTSYNYNLDGSVASATYPSGRTLNYNYFGANNTSAGRLINLTDSNDGTPYVKNALYAPPGEAISYNNGTASNSTAITYANVFGPRLQPLYLSAQNSAGTPILRLCYDFHSAAAVSAGPCSFTASTAGDNGNVYQILNLVSGKTNRSQNFTYDSLNRITSGQSSGPLWGETYTTDAWGNLYGRASISGKTNYEPLNVGGPPNSHNQFTAGFGYDAAGNMTNNNGTTYTFDAENRITSTAGATFTYDGDGNRVEKQGTATTLYWYGSTGDILTETNASGGAVNDYVFFNGKRVARQDSAGALHYYFSDHLGSTTLITDQNGDMSPNPPESDHYPYGGEIVIVADSTNNHYKFTGKERDNETGLDNFGARYNASSMGRFMSPDPKIMTLRHLINPQKWNKYAYVQNNPLAMVDPDGADDYYVFRPLATENSAAWNAIQAEAPKSGNTVTIYNGKSATAANYTTALQTPGAHVVDAGHTVDVADQNRGGINKASSVLLSGNMGVGPAAPTDGTQVAVPTVSASSVAIFGCNSTDLAKQYNGTTFTGTSPTTNTRAEDAGAASYTDTMVRGGSVDQASAAAQKSMVNTTNQVNAQPANQNMPYAKPHVCTTADDSTTCK